MSEIQVAADTSLGVVFVRMTTSGHGYLIVERLMEKVAEAERLPIEEVYEIVSVRRLDDDKAIPLPSVWNGLLTRVLLTLLLILTAASLAFVASGFVRVNEPDPPAEGSA